ncbi:MAG TPA: 16S rRNA (adenine(1518)-N(6)/adenine(1519)-N(6))-dimethyltransferase RsmA [Bacteroidota bacterium]|nr:16S rRNA (adenine(1518)-N(6)/adenine(1519)-N(6))-dimethyltransferase RsmA [Bacteroidota bacterium]
MLKPKKSLGQNFLQDENILRKIVSCLNLQTNDVVFEIGPGQGALTKHLLAHPITLIAAEIDDRAVALLQDSFGNRLELLHQDVLSVDFIKLYQQYRQPLRVVGNIPYYLTSEILIKLFDHHAELREAVLMVQLEVARRLIAKPQTKEYGILTIYANYYSSCELLFKVSRNVFYPKPDVDSAVIRLMFNHSTLPCNEQIFRNVVRSTFGKRRKTLHNGLKYMGFENAQLNSLPFDLTKRPEELSVSDFISLTTAIETLHPKTV